MIFDNYGCHVDRYSATMANEHLADFLRRRAVVLRLTQGEVARRAGVSRQALVKILTGEVRDPRISTVIGLARALQISPFFLLRSWLSSSGERGALSNADRLGDRISFVGFENLPNGAIVAPGTMIEKCWTIQNTGDRVWASRQMRCISRPEAGSPCLLPRDNIIDLPDIEPGQNFEFEMKFRCPEIPGLFASYWKMTEIDGTYVFPDLEPLECIVSVVTF